MSGMKLKACPFCGAELIIGKQRIASCKTEGCMVQHRAVDLDYPKHIAAWNTRTPDPAQIRAECQRRIDAAVLAEREACAWTAQSFLVGDPKNGIPLRSPMPSEIAAAIRARGQK